MNYKNRNRNRNQWFAAGKPVGMYRRFDPEYWETNEVGVRYPKLKK